MTTLSVGAPYFYGWKIVAVVFIAQMLAMGSTVYGFGVFVKPLTAEFGVSRATVNNGFILFMIGMGIFSPLIGRLLDRYPIRHIMLAGALLMGGGLAALAACKTLPMMGLITLLPIAMGATAIGPLVASTLVANWFSRRPGRALGISSVATSVGGALIVPLIAFNVDRFGWQNALVIQGVIVALAVGALALCFIYNRPHDIGLTADGEPAQASTTTGKSQAGETAKHWLLEPNFWTIAISVGLCFAINQSFLVSMIPYATDLGIGLKEATLLLSCSSVASIAGKLLIGALADHIDKRILMLIVIVCTVIQMAVLIAEPGFIPLLIICTLAGFAIGGELPIWGALVADCFGAEKYGAVMGAMSSVNTVLGLLAVYFVGVAFDYTDSYSIAFKSFIGVALFSAVLTFFIRTPKALS